MKSRAEQIREFILKEIERHPMDIVATTESRFNVTRTTVHRHLQRLIKEEKIFKTGTTKNSTYSRLSSFKKNLSFKLTPGLSESEVWEKHFSPVKSQMSENVYSICNYGFTEMFNNAIDHSQGRMVHVESEKDKNIFSIAVFDNGVGIFRKIMEAKKLKDEREAILELSKGKLTTDPSRHSGEGIFFTSRMFDSFSILANGYFYIRDNEEDDWFLEEKSNSKNISTLVTMKIRLNSERRIEDVFKQYTNPDTNAFDRTHILVKLSLSGEEHFVSRSQAKRILVNLEKFKHVVFDFRDIRSVGQAFVDEVFRVFQRLHPEIKMEIVNANDNIKFMIDRGIATAAETKT